MKQISIWASKHVVLARFLLTFIHIALVGIACLLGFLLFLDEIIIEKRAIFLLWTVFLVAYFLYPLKNPRYPFWKKSFRKQKVLDLLIASSIFLILLSMANRVLFELFPTNDNRDYQVVRTSLKTDSPEIKSLSTIKSNTCKAFRAMKRELRKERRLLKKQIRQAKKKEKKKQRLWLKVLLVLGAGGLLFATGSLSCSFICAGSESPAALVGLGSFGYASILAVTGTRELLKK